MDIALFTDSVMDLFGILSSGYEDVKNRFVDKSPSLRDLLHVHAGLALYIVLSYFRKRNISDGIALATILVVSIGAELLDWLGQWPRSQSWLIRDTVGDLLNSLIWPTILFLIGKKLRPIRLE